MGPFPPPRALDCIAGYVKSGLCCVVTGLSNTGKSTSLRFVCASDGQIEGLDDAVLVYIDCNRMIDLSEQALYEVVLRATRARLAEIEIDPNLHDVLEQAYQQVIHPPSPFSVPLGFVSGIEQLCEQGAQRLVLVLDEFDEPFAALEGRIFLNLRALRDRYGARLTLVLGMERAPDDVRSDPETAEFRELFAGHGCALDALADETTAARVQMIAAEGAGKLDEDEVAYVVRQAGNHPGLMQAIVRLLLRARLAAPETYARMRTGLVTEALRDDERAQRECARLWSQLTEQEQAALALLAVGRVADETARLGLARLGLVDEEGRVFGAAFAAFVRRQELTQGDFPPGVWLDTDAGDVFVDGRRLPPLTDLEYRLMRTLVERQGKLCDKYQLVEAVWGESYIDAVDDARVEKLVSRLRAKIETDPANPRYLETVRGRGYRLVGT